MYLICPTKSAVRAPDEIFHCFTTLSDPAEYRKELLATKAATEPE
jgi:hypothetical protein